MHDQFAAQKIFFPPKSSEAAPEIGRHPNEYAAQQLVKETAGGKAYAEVSTLARRSPNDGGIVKFCGSPVRA